jgi:hypothetical protein
LSFAEHEFVRKRRQLADRRDTFTPLHRFLWRVEDVAKEFSQAAAIYVIPLPDH